VSRAEQSSGELAHDIVDEARDLLHLQVQLAKQELTELLWRNGIAVALMMVGGLLVMLALLIALPVLIVLLWWNHVLGAVIWFGAYFIVGAALVLAGRLSLRLEPPRRTLTSLQETKQWVLRQIRSNGR
jgi:uncharacterized membrane protein YqjE